MSEDKLLTADEVAQLLSVPTRFVREHTRSGAIPHVRIPGSRFVRYRRASLHAWVESLEVGGHNVKTRRHTPRTPE